MLTRRQVIKRGALVSLAPLVPTFLARTAQAAEAEKDCRVLVVVQLDGGNDGLNTVVPFRDEQLCAAAPQAASRIGPADQDRRRPVASRVAQGPGPAAGRWPVERRTGGRLPEPQPVALPEHGDLALRAARRSRPRPVRLVGPHARCRIARGRRAASGLHRAGALPVALWSRRSTTITVRSKEDFALAAPAELLASRGGRRVGRTGAVRGRGVAGRVCHRRATGHAGPERRGNRKM